MIARCVTRSELAIANAQRLPQRASPRCASALLRFAGPSLLPAVAAVAAAAAGLVADAIDQVQPKMVKIYGAGGFRGHGGLSERHS